LYFKSVQKQSLTLQDVLNNNLGQKDRHQGLFDVWGAVFRVSIHIYIYTYIYIRGIGSGAWERDWERGLREKLGAGPKRGTGSGA